MNCHCYERFFAISSVSKSTYPKIINRYKFIRDELRQSQCDGLPDLLQTSKLARDCLLYKLFGSKTGMIHTPVLNHDCEMFKNYELKLIALKIDDELEKPAIEILHSVRQGIIKPIELQPANSSSIISTAGSSFGTASSADQFPSSCGVNHVYRYSSSLSLNVPKKHVVAASVPKYFTFRNKIETVIKHYYRPKGTTFLVTWQGFDLPPMEEPLMLVMELGKGPLKEYLSRCGRRALTTLLRRHPEIGGMTRNSI